MLKENSRRKIELMSIFKRFQGKIRSRIFQSFRQERVILNLNKEKVIIKSIFSRGSLKSFTTELAGITIFLRKLDFLFTLKNKIRINALGFVLTSLLKNYVNRNILGQHRVPILKVLNQAIENNHLDPQYKNSICSNLEDQNNQRNDIIKSISIINRNSIAVKRQNLSCTLENDVFVRNINSYNWWENNLNKNDEEKDNDSYIRNLMVNIKNPRRLINKHLFQYIKYFEAFHENNKTLDEEKTNSISISANHASRFKFLRESNDTLLIASQLQDKDVKMKMTLTKIDNGKKATKKYDINNLFGKVKSKKSFASNLIGDIADSSSISFKDKSVMTTTQSNNENNDNIRVLLSSTYKDVNSALKLFGKRLNDEERVMLRDETSNWNLNKKSNI